MERQVTGQAAIDGEAGNGERHCPACGKSFALGDRYCAECGAPLPMGRETGVGGRGPDVRDGEVTRYPAPDTRHLAPDSRPPSSVLRLAGGGLLLLLLAALLLWIGQRDDTGTIVMLSICLAPLALLTIVVGLARAVARGGSEDRG